jgi:hypothetical protein
MQNMMYKTEEGQAIVIKYFLSIVLECVPKPYRAKRMEHGVKTFLRRLLLEATTKYKSPFPH